MKRLSIILAAVIGLAGAVSGSALQSLAVGCIVGYATSPEIGAFVAAAMFTISFVLPSSKHGFAYATVFTEGICEKVQQSLNSVLGSQSPSLKRTQVGYTQAIISPQNTAGTEAIQIDPGSGKKKIVRLKYIQRGTGQDLVTTKPTTCTPTDFKTPFEEDVEITEYLGTAGLGFSENEMRKLCEADQDYIAAQINSEIDPLIKELNSKLITTQSTNFGAFNPEGVVTKNVDLLTAANAPHYYGESVILNDFENIDSSRRPIVIGSGILGHYVRQVGIGCCNDGGVNIGQAGNMDFFRDRFVGDILGDPDDFIGLVPGYVQLLTFNEFVGSYAKENDVFSKSTIMDPVTGLNLDMKWSYDHCKEEYYVQFGLWYKLWFIPANSFAAYDELEGVNFTLHYNANKLP